MTQRNGTKILHRPGDTGETTKNSGKLVFRPRFEPDAFRMQVERYRYIIPLDVGRLEPGLPVYCRYSMFLGVRKCNTEAI